MTSRFCFGRKSVPARMAPSGKRMRTVRPIDGFGSDSGGSIRRLRTAGIGAEEAMSRKRRPGRVGYRHGSALLSPTLLPAADRPARDLALSAVHIELPGRGGATGRTRPGGFL